MLLREALSRVSLSPFRLRRSVGARPKSELRRRRSSEESPHGTLYLHALETIIKDKIARISKQTGKKPRCEPTPDMATKHMLEKDMLRPSNPWNPDHLVDSSSRTNNQYSYEIRANFLRFCIQAREEKQTPTYKQKIQFLKGEMPEWRQMKMGRQFRVWQTDKHLYLSSTECD